MYCSIPSELDFDSHMIEYFPGTYGDFVCAIISYSIDEFFDPVDPAWTRENAYWRSSENTIMLRNKYPLSCRGNGYEHVEKYTELMLGHKIFLDYPDLLIKNHNYKKIMFNTHMRLNNNNATELDSRTLNNNFTKTRVKALTIDMDFDSILMSVCNEYFTSTERSISNPDIKKIGVMFSNRVKTLKWTERHIPEEKKLKIGNILEFNPSVIQQYGNVNEQKFNEYFKEYSEKKLELLQNLTIRTKNKFLFADRKIQEWFEDQYDRTYESFFNT